MRLAVVFLFIFFLGLMLNSEGSTRENFVPSKFKANFIQEYKSVMSGKVKRGKGKVDYHFPGRLRFEMVTPDPLIFITNATQNWYYRPPFIEGEKGELRKNVKGGNVFADFFDSLSEGLKSNDYYSVKMLSKKAELSFTPEHAKELGLKSAILWFKSDKDYRFLNLKEITLVYNDDRETKIIFESLETAKSFVQGHFYFKTP